MLPPSATRTDMGVVGWCDGVVYLTSPERQMILAYSWARPVTLVAGKGKGGCFYFFCFFTFIPFIPVPLSSLSLTFISSTISSISFLPFSERRQKWPTRVDVSLNPNTSNKSELTNAAEHAWHKPQGEKICLLTGAQRRHKFWSAPSVSAWRIFASVALPWLSKMRPVKILISLRECFFAGLGMNLRWAHISEVLCLLAHMVGKVLNVVFFFLS